MNKYDMCFECKYFAWGCGTCELDGKDCSGDNIECPNYVDRNIDGEYDEKSVLE